MFKVIEEIKDFNICNIGYTKHSSERYYRKNETCKIYKIFLIDKGHKKGLEIHVIFEDSTIMILNNETKKLITYLKPRVPQLKRYGLKSIPFYMFQSAIMNNLLKKNI